MCPTCGAFIPTEPLFDTMKQVKILQPSSRDEDVTCPLYRFIEDNLESLSPEECYYLNLMEIGISFDMGVHFGWVTVLRVEDRI